MTTPTSAAQPDPAPPSDAALPVDVQAALNFLCDPFQTHASSGVTVAQKAALVRTHIATLRSQNAALAKRIRELEANPPPVLLTPGLPDLDEMIGNVRNPSWDIARYDRQVLGAMLSARERIAALVAERDEAKKQAEIAVNSQRTICRAAERLTAERDALRGEVEELKFQASIPAEDLAAIKARARIEALRWVLRDLHANRFMPQPDTLIEEINDELARLQSESALGVEGAE